MIKSIIVVRCRDKAEFNSFIYELGNYDVK